MDFQTVIVAIIIVFAIGFISLNLWRKVKSFSVKSDCGDNCGCDSGSTKKLTHIQRN